VNPWTSAGYQITRFLCRCLFAPVVRLHVVGRERTHREGAWILAANHIAHFDPPLIAAAVQRTVDWMAMADLFTNRFTGLWLRSIGSFPLDRERSDPMAVRMAIRRLRAGRVVGMFPEGGLRDGAASVLGGARLKRGLGAIARAAGASVVPCVILGSDRLYRIQRWLPLRRTRVWIGFGESMPPPARGTDPDGFDEKVADALRGVAGELRRVFELTDADFPKPPKERMRGA
jgi:1-acyl-sn-glycerol-3-phosphate acyltransferase